MGPLIDVKHKQSTSNEGKYEQNRASLRMIKEGCYQIRSRTSFTIYIIAKIEWFPVLKWCLLKLYNTNRINLIQRLNCLGLLSALGNLKN